MRRAVITGIVAALVTVSAAAYLSGLLAFQFLNAVEGETGAVVASVVQAAGAQALVVMSILVVALVATASAARIVLVGLGVRRPLTALRGPLVLTVAGAVATIWIAFPGPFLVLVGGVAWGTVRLADELGLVGPRTVHHPGGEPDGDLSDFV